MPFSTLPTTIDEIDGRQWESFEPYFTELNNRPITPETQRQWLNDWSDLLRLLEESVAMIYIQKSLDTADKAKEADFLTFIQNVYPKTEVANQALIQRLLTLDIPDEDMALVIRNMRNEAEIFREENLPLITQMQQLDNEYDKVTGGIQIDWDGESKNLSQMTPLLQSKERPLRKRAWQALLGAWLSKRERIDTIYTDLLKLRVQIATNAGFDNYRDYAFRERGRFAYTPEDCLIFHDAIEKVVVPVAQRIIKKRQERLGLSSLRPWDWIPEKGISIEGNSLPSLTPYQQQDDLVAHTLNIFHQVDPQLGRYFATMAEDDLLDLDTRQGKALGGYCHTLPLRRRPFIFMNGTGTHDDVQTMLHEAGHAFHAFESLEQLPLIWQTDAPMEFCEVASMSMELIAGPYLTSNHGGFYTPSEAARGRIDHLEHIILFWPYMAVVDAFQHWVYTHPTAAMDPANCDAAWDDLWQRFIPGVDWTGYETERRTGWHRKPHIFGSPFYYIEYGIAQVGAVQVWRNSLKDQAGAVSAYRQALALGGVKTLPELFKAAGAEFRLDREMLSSLVSLIEENVAILEKEI